MLIGKNAYSQDFSNKGKDFYIAYTGHIDGTGSVMGIYLTSDVNATGTVKVGSQVLPFTVIANQITRLFIGPNGGGSASNLNVYNGQADGINLDAGIRVQSDKNIVVYAHIIRAARSGATLVLPTQVLGKDYIVPSFRNTGGGGQGGEAGYGQITVVAVEPNTTIEITPTVGSRSGTRPAGVPFEVVLASPGDVYQLQSTQHLDYSGSRVRSVPSRTGGGGQGCKPIAVFSSTTWSGFDCQGASGGDNLYQQLFPTKSWGKKFVTAPFISKAFDIIRVFVQTPGTVVTKTELGATATLTGLVTPGNYYEIKTANPLVIESSEPVSLAQYITSQTCDNVQSDPEMTLINPVEQTLSSITLFSAHANYVPAGQTQVSQHFLNVVIPTSHKSTFRINNNLPSGFFIDIPGAGYSYLQEDVTFISGTNPVHTLKADTGFTCIVYGYGNVESYGYNAGTNVRDLYQFINIQNEYASVNYPASCAGTPFFFSMVFPYQPTQIVWQFGGLFPDVTINNPVHDSTWTVNGRQLYRYKLPTSYSVPVIGIYPIKVIAQNPSPDGCGNTQEINFDLEILGKPQAAFTFTTNGCVSDSVRFFDGSSTNGRPITSYRWDFDDGTLSSLKNPAHLFPSTGIYTVKHNVITDVGCISDTAEQVVNLSSSPTARFQPSGTYCPGGTITFTDQSTTTISTLNKWIWNFGDGAPDFTTNTNAPQSHTYANPGTYYVTLQVETVSGCRSGVFRDTIVINPNPVANFTFGNGCLPNATIQFTNSSTISDGSQAQLTYTWDFGDGGSSTNANPSHTYAGTGPYNVTLVTTSNNGCTNNTVKSVATIFAQPVAQFTAPAEVCLGAPVNLQDQSTTTNSNITSWNWNFGDGTTSTQQNPVKNYTSAGNYTITLTVTTAAGCTSAPLPKQVTVNAAPVAAFTVQGAKCMNSPVTFVDASTSSSGNLVKWTWNFGDNSAPLIANSNTPVTHTYTGMGTFDVTLVVENNKGCVSTISTQQVVVSALPEASFTLPENCVNDPFSQFTDNSIVGGPQGQLTYLWNFGDVNATAANPNTSTVQNPRHKYSVVGPYTVTLIVTSIEGCTDTLAQTFTVNGAQPQSLFTINGGNEYCSGNQVTITNNSTVDPGSVIKVEVSWDLSDPTNVTVDNDPAAGKTYTANYPQFYSPVQKTVSIRVRAYSGETCFNDVVQTITLKAMPEISFSNPAAICADAAPIMLQASVTNGVTGTGVFSGNGVNAAGLFNPITAGQGAHVIRYTYTSDNGCNDFKEQTVNVYPLPTVNITSPVIGVLEGGAITMPVIATGNNLSYLWTPALYLNSDTAPKPIVSPLQDQGYRVVVTSADGCSATDSVFVRLLKTPDIPNAFSPNGDGVHDKWEIPYLDSYQGATIQVYNRYGQLVFESKGYFRPWDGTYKGKDLPVGTYYYIINPKNGRKQMTGFVDIIR